VIDVQGALWAQYAADGDMLDLTPYLKKDPDFASRFTPGALDLWQSDGKTWMVPWYFTRTLLYLNKRMMRAAGIAKAPTTFDELMADAKKMSGEGKSGFLTTNFDWLYWPLFKMNGVDILDKDMSKAAFNTPAAQKTLTALADATKSGAINNISWTGRWVEPNTAFASGNVGMYMSLSSALFWAASKAGWIDDKNVEVVNAPGGWWVPSQHGWGVSKASKHPDAAVDLIKIATSDKWQTTMASTFSILTLNKDVDKKLIANIKSEDPLKSKVLDLDQPDMSTITGYLKSAKEGRVKEAFWGAIQPALLGQTDPKAALDSAEALVNRALSRP
jgi:ABC-type glycerol-3-phosphate transport system substrate-binding protein